jgi:DNA-binding protein YbaB
MDTMNNQQKHDECYENLPSPERTAELLEKASKVTSWLSALKQKSRQRLFVGKSEDGKFCVVLRNYRIESLSADESLKYASAQEIVSRLCEAHDAALDQMEEWSAGQCTALAKAAGITAGLELPF